MDLARQAELAKRRASVADMKQGVYLFKDIQLTRADVEWLLAMHEQGQGSIRWNEERQRERPGLDLRGAYLNDKEPGSAEHTWKVSMPLEPIWGTNPGQPAWRLF
ncbi:MAG TPA: hypothetical protein VGF67_30960 [Ktedonobacteraceae bacterium]